MIDAARVALDAIVPMRERYRREMGCQIVHDSLHARGFTHPYVIRISGEAAGYGCVLGYDDDPKDIVKEFYLLPRHRAAAAQAFDAFVSASGAKTIEAQTNDRLLTLMLFDRASHVDADKILFDDGFTTTLPVPGVEFTKSGTEWALVREREIVATGGLLFHYNPPYGDIYMEVAEPCRRRGYGSYLVQELKRACYEAGRVPAARCNASNIASRAALQKAGMLPCARILRGKITG